MLLTSREHTCASFTLTGLASFAVSPLATVEELSLAHDPAYISSFLRGTLEPMHQKRIGFPWTAEGVDRALSSVGGTVAAARAVCEPLQEGAEPLLFAGHLAGGTHHAFADRGEGYCVFSDIAVAARVVLNEFPTSINKVLIVDLDVHQGAYHYYESSECAHVSIHSIAEVSCYRLERTLMGCRGVYYGIRGSPSVSSS